MLEKNLDDSITSSPIEEFQKEYIQVSPQFERIHSYILTKLH